MHRDPPPWGADPSIAWRILLTARLDPGLDAGVLAARQAALHQAQGWPAPPPVAAGDLASLRRDLAEVRDAPLLLGLDGDHLVISAFHAWIDGLGLLEVLASLIDAPVTTSARGVAARPTESGGTVGRLLEVVTAPPASVATDAATPVAGDSYARASLAVPLRTAELLHAAAAAIVSHNTDAGRGTRHLTIAVGAGKPATAGALLANRSELIRLRDLEGVALEEVRARLKTAPLNPAGGSGSTPGPLAGLALRALAPRLGSTLLVSHLGEVTASAVSDLAFYPVTSGGTGLSLGAVHHRGATTLTLRGRAARWTDEALGVLLARVTAQISRP